MRCIEQIFGWPIGGGPGWYSEYTLIRVKLLAVAPQAIEDLLEVIDEVFRIGGFDYHIVNVGLHPLAPVVG
jgi:hypothetical protein